MAQDTIEPLESSGLTTCWSGAARPTEGENHQHNKIGRDLRGCRHRNSAVRITFGEPLTLNNSASVILLQQLRHYEMTI